MSIRKLDQLISKLEHTKVVEQFMILQADEDHIVDVREDLD